MRKDLLVKNTVVCVAMISAGCSVQMVKLVSSLIFLIRPLVLRAYVNRRYGIDRKAKYEEEPIKQKWNGVAQHVVIILPYNLMILAAGHYKQTQSNYIVAAALNIVISIVLVSRFGLI